MRSPLINHDNQNILEENDDIKNNEQYNERVSVITEVGMCFSSSMLYHYQNPYGLR